MSELTILFIVMATLATAYLWLYPRFAGDSLRKLQLWDVALTAVPLLLAGIMHWGSDTRFTLLFFETNWFVFTLLTYVILEIPLFAWYVKARGLGKQMREQMLRPADGDWFSASSASVEKQLVDERWNGLRTPRALRGLVSGANVVVIFGTGLLWGLGTGNADDSVAFWVMLIYILLLGVFGYLLRKAVRLIADAPESVLDERMLQARNRAQAQAFRGLSVLVTLALAGFMAWIVVQDAESSVAASTYTLTLAWSQVQAIFWLPLFYALTLPSMALALAQARLESPART